MLRLDDADARLFQQSTLERVQVARSDEAPPLIGDRGESGNRRRELGPAAAGDDGYGGSIQKSAARSLRSVEVAVRVEPRDTCRIGAEAGESPDGCIAVPSEHNGKATGLTRAANCASEHAHQLEAGLDLRVPEVRGKLRDFCVNGVTALAERALQPGFKEPYRAAAHPSAAIP